MRTHLPIMLSVDMLNVITMSVVTNWFHYSECCYSVISASVIRLRVDVQIVILLNFTIVSEIVNVVTVSVVKLNVVEPMEMDESDKHTTLQHVVTK